MKAYRARLAEKRQAELDAKDAELAALKAQLSVRDVSE